MFREYVALDVYTNINVYLNININVYELAIKKKVELKYKDLHFMLLSI